MLIVRVIKHVGQLELVRRGFFVSVTFFSVEIVSRRFRFDLAVGGRGGGRSGGGVERKRRRRWGRRRR